MRREMEHVVLEGVGDWFVRGKGGQGMVNQAGTLIKSQRI